MNRKQKTWLWNALFLVAGAAILLVLWNAPPETTSMLPHDDNHQRFMTMKKKEAEKFCSECHSENGIVPLPPGHPPKYRCLFCHKRQ